MVICYLCEQSYEQDKTIRTVVPTRKNASEKERICLECAKLIKSDRTSLKPFIDEKSLGK